MYRTVISSGLALFLISCANTGKVQTVPAVQQSQFESPPEDIRNYRYCEIIPIFRSGVSFTAEVYNTIDANQCPKELWDALDGDELKNELGAFDLKMNGPRFWTINAIQGEDATAEGKTVDFGGIEMIWRAEIETKLWEGTVGAKFYNENQVQRSTTYTYNAGETVYELTSPQGSVYRMQSYAQIVDPNLTIEDLSSLGKRLALPEGWSFEARIIHETEYLVAGGLAFVINDDLGSSYQKVNP